MSTDEFYRQYLFKEPFAAQRKALEFRKLISWPLLSEIFQTGYNDCWLPKYGKLPSNPSLSNGTLSLEQAMTAFETDGRSIVIRHSERSHPVLKAIANDFYKAFGDPIDIQLYATPGEQEGFDWHYDIEEVIVIQSSGEKEFRLKIPKTLPPLDRVQLPDSINFEDDFVPGEIRCLLKPGDWLYIPAGIWHKAQAITNSFHMSIGVLSSKRDRGTSDTNRT